MAKMTKGAFDDALSKIHISDFSGGLVTQYGPLTLASNQSPDLRNVIGYPGRLSYCGGFSNFSDLTSADADGAWEFYDSSGIKHLMVWRGGDLYDCASGSEVLVAAAVYTAGEQIARIDQNEILYWATPSVVLRQYDGTTEQAVTNAGGAGVVAPPAGSYLSSYAGQLIMCNPVITGTPSPGAFIACTVNDPTRWLSSTIQQVGTDYGELAFVLPMGVAQTGVPSTTSLVAAKATQYLYAYKGAIGSLDESLINCPVGCLDGNSAIYIPSKTNLGTIMFLGSDYQIWKTDGLMGYNTTQGIQNYMFAKIQNALSTNPTQKFFGVFYPRYQYYLLDIGGNQQLAYRYETEGWFPFQGWPSGPYCQGHATSGLPTVFVAANTYYTAGVYEVGLRDTDFNDTYPEIYYDTPYLHGGDPAMVKDLQWAELGALNQPGRYEVTGSTLPFADNTTLETDPAEMRMPASEVTESGGVWDVDSWDLFDWGGGVDVGSTAPPVFLRTMLQVMAPADVWTGPAAPQPFRSNAARFRIQAVQEEDNPPYFDLVSFLVRFNPLGRMMMGGQDYSAESYVDATPDPFVGDF